jgi:hypothetical protein
VIIFDSNNPPNETNVYSGPYSNNFTIKSYIYEPNLAYLPRLEITTPIWSQKLYKTYDNDLALMFNFDNVKEI